MHPSKVFGSIDFKEQGFSNIISFKKLHEVNASSQIDVTVECIKILVNAHRLKAPLQIIVTDDGIDISTNERHPLKAY